MFDFQNSQIEGRKALGLPSRGRLSAEQRADLDNYMKNAYSAYLVENEVISDEAATVAFYASFPTNDENFVSRSEGCKANNIHPSKYQSEGGPAMERLFNLEFHDGVTEWAIEEETEASAARPADGVSTRGRKPGTKNRDKATIEAEKAAKAIRVEGRKSLGLPERGRLSAEQAEQLEAYVTKHS